MTPPVCFRVQKDRQAFWDLLTVPADCAIQRSRGQSSSDLLSGNGRRAEVL